MMLDILINIIALGFRFTHEHVWVRIHIAEIARQQSGSQVSPDLCGLSMEMVARHPSGDQNLEMTPRRCENLWICYVGSNDVTENVRINVTLRGVRATVVVVEKQ
jgi:hypothetical protein